jgi:NAD(P)-dependent dehydrogenase (short-subunit alcohol dehydrogenase family)
LKDVKHKVLITGASGLLGRALVREFLAGGHVVVAQYHCHQPVPEQDCQWLQADFSHLEGIRDFLVRNRKTLSGCHYLVNNYGPITSKPVAELRGEDFQFDYHHNVITAVEITRFLLKNAQLQCVVNLGFEFQGEQRPYRKILTYAAAKNALLLVTRSFQKEFPGTRFYMVSLPTLAGAQVKAKDSKPVAPESAAREIVNCCTGQPCQGQRFEKVCSKCHISFAF